ncbi:MAG: glycosyltransferase [Coleofasciculus sp. D1-CHI-01]|uniref:glycosyltransferase n=1 Tax=Coleofasciculus sp. D1-CHI-01 TaxID=3068482 RepID=UPI0032FE05A4
MNKDFFQDTGIQVLHSLRDISQDKGGVPIAVIRLVEAIADYDQTIQIRLGASPGCLPILSKTQIKSNLKWNPLSENLSQSFKHFLHDFKDGTSVDTSCSLVHDHGIWLPNNHAIAVESRRLGIPRIVTPHGMLENWALNYKAWKKRIAWHFFQYSDLKTTQVLHATSNAEALNLRKLFPDLPIVMIPLGVDRLPTITKKGSHQSQKTVLFIGRIHPVKGLSNLIEAWSHLNSKSWQLIIAGNDERNYQGFLEKKAKQLGVIDTINLMGYVDREAKWKLYQEADVFVLPSFTENFGIVIAEALASGTPAIATKGTPWSDLVTYRCGWWIDSGVMPLVEALREAMESEQIQRTEMGYRGRQLVESKYTWERTAEQMIEVYEWILYRQQKPTSMLD